ncbi:hypothetical protein AJ78_09055 [Emergomyces pasteurianus Ep9510]|uniref:RING-type domain-containing protein n=1 Tax=Emergomyces pasteurianus Ep9510 TaxID=1447872 RepID=A0A1J9P0W0_9EURO|nr:hypothetical protein AJ78_09055 [Emergomyces pasteurianus Ep9510]
MSTDSPRDGLHDTIIIMYETLFNDPAPSELLKPLKKRKILNLDMVLETVNQGILDIFKVEHAKRKALKEEVQHLRAEMIRKNKLINELKTKVRKLKHQCQCQICYTIPSGWRTLLCGHWYCPECLPPIGATCGTCRQVITGVIKSY